MCVVFVTVSLIYYEWKITILSLKLSVSNKYICIEVVLEIAIKKVCESTIKATLLKIQKKSGKF